MNEKSSVNTAVKPKYYLGFIKLNDISQFSCSPKRVAINLLLLMVGIVIMCSGFNTYDTGLAVIGAVLWMFGLWQLDISFKVIEKPLDKS